MYQFLNCFPSFIAPLILIYIDISIRPCSQTLLGPFENSYRDVFLRSLRWDSFNHRTRVIGKLNIHLPAWNSFDLSNKSTSVSCWARWTKKGFKTSSLTGYEGLRRKVSEWVVLLGSSETMKKNAAMRYLDVVPERDKLMRRSRFPSIEVCRWREWSEEISAFWNSSGGVFNRVIPSFKIDYK